ncbi:hypothetical protein CDN98_09060 [Roseateles terrae]|nr:hypothetical protein CDN98_09060 [Roseateles terrae]
MAAFQSQQNQQQLDMASAMSSAQNTQTMVQKMMEEANQKRTTAMIEKTQYYSHLPDKINLGQ